MIPIFNINKNQLTSLNGEVSTFFELLPPDMEGRNEIDTEQMIKGIEEAIINTNGVFKVYKLKNKIYLNQFGEIELPQAKLIEENEPLRVLIEDDEVDIHYYENYFTQGNEFKRILSFVDFPSTIYTHDVLNWPDFVLHFRKVDKLVAKERVNLQRRLHFSSLFKNLRDFNAENAFEQAEAVLEGVNRDEIALFECECFLILSANTKSELDQITHEMIYSFRGQNAKLITEERGLSYFHRCLLPGVKPSFKRKILTPSHYLSELIPFSRDFIHEDGMKLRARSGNTLSFDLFNEASINFNVLITGASGQGKSMLANKILQHELAQNSKAMVLDLGNSFLKNAKYHSGVVLSQKINPLQFKDARYLKEFILAGIDEKMNKKEQGILFETIKDILENQTCENFSQFLNHLEHTFQGVSFYFSELKDYFDSEIRELTHFTYCDFSLYPEAMKAPLIIYLIESFKRLEGKKIFVFDECWHLLNNNADYIAECFRTFRKHQASAVAISQNLDDFSTTQLGRVIIQNTFYKFLFRQSLRSSEFLDQDKIDLLNTIQSNKGHYSEALLLSDYIQKPVRYYPTPLEYEIFTTDRAELNQFENYLKSGGEHLNFKQALVNFTVLKNPTWRAEYETH
jgi:Cdc6-like AAA superfamily ATPase